MPYTVVSFHAHPDDEALLTGGTLARVAAEGHRVVLVTATAGESGLTSPRIAAGGPLGRLRMEELRRSARAMGCDDVRLLGYQDSGMGGTAGEDGAAFSRADPEEAAARLSEVLVAVGADLLTVYDPAGGYGHPDHVQVHRVGVRAAEMAGTPVVLAATVDRRALQRAVGVLSRTGVLRFAPAEWRPERLRNAYAEPATLTHRVDVRAHAGAKRAAMAAHRSQRHGGRGSRSLGLFLLMPPWLFRRVFGYEWFAELGREPAGTLLDDIFASLEERGDTTSGR